MKGRIITRKERRTRPLAAVLLSLALPGLGEMYAGVPARGFALFIIRLLVLLVPPLYAAIHADMNVLKTFSIAITALAAVTIASPVQALLLSLKKRTSHQGRFDVIPVYVIVFIAGFCLTAMAAALFFGTFRPFRAIETSYPILASGDLALSRRPAPPLCHGDMVMFREGKTVRISRVAGLEGDQVAYDGEKVIVNGSPLRVKIFSLEETGEMGLPETHDVVAEQNGSVMYPVTTPSSSGKTPVPATVPAGSAAVLPDDRRNGTEKPVIIQTKDVIGRVEGVLYGPSGRRLLVPSSLASDTE